VGHVVLLGDSVFDNAHYVPGGPAVIEQLRARLPRGWRATLLAVDGAVAEDVPRQVPLLPADATHLVVSVGGNDALANSAILADASRPAADAFADMAEIQENFRRDYRDMLRAVLAARLPTAVCTVYDAVPGLPPKAVTGLSVFNDVILREAVRAGLPVLDLRLVCDEARDYSAVSPIEPSERGGAKIVLGLVRLVTGHDFGRGECVVFGK
jgi:hypothetical protein